MQEFRCSKCEKMLGMMFSSEAICINDNKNVQQMELDGKHVKRIEIKCPRCKNLNKVMI